jgi:hypothetical protein
MTRRRSPPRKEREARRPLASEQTFEEARDALFVAVPEGSSAERQTGITRAMQIVARLLGNVSDLLDASTPDERVREIARDSARAASWPHTPEFEATMALVHAILATAHEIRRARDLPGWESADLPQWQHFAITRWLAEFEWDWPEYGARLDSGVFWTAAEKWLEVHDGVGRDRWRPVADAVDSAGLGPCRPDSLARQWKRAMAVPRDKRSHG